MAQVEVVEGHPDIPEESRKKLSPGAQARIYRDGNVLEGACLIPQKGDLELRHLAPGSYVVKDETGGYEEFKVLPKVETVAVPTRYSASRTSNEDKAAKDELKGTSRRKVSKKKQEEPTAEEIQSGQPEDEKRDVVASEPNDGDNLPGVTGAEAWQELKAKASSHAETTEKAPKGKGK